MSGTNFREKFKQAIAKQPKGSGFRAIMDFIDEEDLKVGYFGELLTEREWKVYDALVRHSLPTQRPDCTNVNLIQRSELQTMTGLAEEELLDAISNLLTVRFFIRDKVYSPAPFLLGERMANYHLLESYFFIYDINPEDCFALDLHAQELLMLKKTSSEDSAEG